MKIRRSRALRSAARCAMAGALLALLVMPASAGDCETSVVFL